MRAATGLFFVFLAAGCGPAGPAVYPAKGRVIFRDGKPVAAGVVEFHPAGGGPAARGKLGPDGRFELTTGGRPGAVAGPHAVTVTQMVVADGAAEHLSAKHANLVVARKYNRPATSTLSATITPGENDVLLEVAPEVEKRGW